VLGTTELWWDLLPLSSKVGRCLPVSLFSSM
jgi:hypothetical protein